MDELREVNKKHVIENLEVWLAKLGFNSTQATIMASFTVSRFEVLAAKRADYGSANIAMTGMPGVAVRVLDKAARLWNLQTRKAQVTGETNLDTIGDIFGYAQIGAVLMEGEEW